MEMHSTVAIVNQVHATASQRLHATNSIERSTGRCLVNYVVHFGWSSAVTWRGLAVLSVVEEISGEKKSVATFITNQASVLGIVLLAVLSWGETR